MVHEGVSLPKPLVELEGKPMIGRLIDLFASYEPESLTIIINNSMNDVRQYLESIVSSLGFPVEIILKDTSGSMESVYEVSHAFDRGKTVLSTVDSVFSRAEWDKFIRSFAANDADDGLFPVTDFIDDEKPLYVDTDADGYITAFRDEPSANDFYISGGIYGITPRCNGRVRPSYWGTFAPFRQAAPGPVHRQSFHRLTPSAGSLKRERACFFPILAFAFD